MGHGHYGCLAHFLAGGEHGFDFCCGEPVAGNVDTVVYASQDPEIAVLVHFRTVAGLVAAKATEVGLVLCLIVVDAKHDAGPGLANDKVAGLAILACVHVGRGGIAHDGGVNAWQRSCGGTGLQACGIGQGRNHGAAGLGLPPRVHDGQFAVADVAVVPLPDLWAYGFANGPQDAQGAQIVALAPGLAQAHEGADDSGGSVEDVHAELFHYAPVAVGLGPGGHALEHEDSGTKGQGAVDAIGVASDPAYVCSAPVHVVVVHVKEPLGGVGGIGEIAACGVQNTSGLAGAAACVQQKERIRGIHALARVIHVQGEVLDQIVPPDVTVGLHLDVFKVGVVHDNHMGDGGALFDDGIKIGLERLFLAGTNGSVGSDHDLGLGALDTAAHATLGIAGENGCVDGTDTCAGEHGYDELRDHGHVEGHTIALAHTQGA